MTDLIYIVGARRSGSTVIERVINSAAEVVGIGEVHALWRLPVEELRCSCGEQVPTCPFWQSALNHAGIGSKELARMAELERSVVRNTYLLKLDYDLSKIRKDAKLAEFIALNKALFEGCRAASGGRIVLDSSKAGPRAWVLAAGFSPLYLHTYRGAGDVIASWRKAKFNPATGKPMERLSIGGAAKDWLKAEYAARNLASKAKVQRITYSQFAQSPRQTLEDALESDIPGLVNNLAWTGEASIRPSETYHSVLGNPDRFNSTDIQIRPKAVDRSQLSPIDRIGVQAVGGLLQAIYR